ncbi:MAG: response regulator [Thermostichales cyanobacterium BF4_bins_65]
MAEKFLGSILLVDDTLENLEVLDEMLSEKGYETRSASSGQMALRAAQADPPDLILLDIMMPDMDGYEVCTRLKSSSETWNIPIIFISALDDVIDKVRAFQVGGVDYLTKPFFVDEVIARVEVHLENSYLQRLLQERADNMEQVQETIATLKDRVQALESRLRQAGIDPDQVYR